MAANTKELIRPSSTSVVTMVTALLIYAFLAIRLTVRIVTSNVNSSAAGFFLGVVLTSILIVVVGVLMAFANRDRREWPFVVVGSATFGVVLCLIFYGA